SPLLRAIKPAAFTELVAPNKNPFLLNKKSWPLDVNEPFISDGALPPMMFSVAAAASGVLNVTVLPWLMLKESQLMTAEVLLCVMVIVLPSGDDIVPVVPF